jgi:hypothetical protein
MKLNKLVISASELIKMGESQRDQSSHSKPAAEWNWMPCNFVIA